MFYYPQLLTTPNVVNLQVVIPGGWGQLKSDEPGLHFLWEALFFAPTKTIADPDKWLWENTLDFWSVTSFESIRLNFTLRQQQVKTFIPGLLELLQPRDIPTDFLNRELQDLKHYWQTERQTQEDEVIRGLFPDETVVHPNRHLVESLTPENLSEVLALWHKARPHLIIIGVIEIEDLSALKAIFPSTAQPKSVSNYHLPVQAQSFFRPTRWGIKVELHDSHWFELLMIELWEQHFKAQFFFEYHQDTLFIWTDEVEHPHHLARQVLNYSLTESDFIQAQQAYTLFLSSLTTSATQKSLEKLAELVEGLHPHPYQSPTFGIDLCELDLVGTIKRAQYEAFKTFYAGFMEGLKKDHSSEWS